MQGTIGFENLKVDCIIGELSEERIQEQLIFISLKVKYDFSICASTDDINDTIDYVALADECRNEAIEGKYNMLETYVSRVLDRLLSKYPITEAWVLVRKPNGLPSADCSFVELTKGRI